MAVGLDSVMCGYCGQPLPAFAQRCPRCLRDISEMPDSRNVVKTTVLEQTESVRAERHTKRADTGDAVPYRPVMRPKRAMLCVLDDGSNDGEWLRIRTGRLTIGRTEGDVLIPDDEGISGRHAEIVREDVGGYQCWMLRDLESRNGTFVRVSDARLTHGMHLLIGLRRFSFELRGNQPEEAPETFSRQATRAFALPSARPLAKSPPKLIEIGPPTQVLEIEFKSKTFTIGSSPEQATFVIPDDPTVSPVHASIAQDEVGRWVIENTKSLNGVWCRVNEQRVDNSCSFQLGEQRFLLQVR